LSFITLFLSLSFSLSRACGIGVSRFVSPSINSLTHSLTHLFSPPLPHTLCRYAFCAVAALALLGESRRADLPALERWVAARQLRKEGGFAGRTNKLVDGCYSFWQVLGCIVGGYELLLDSRGTFVWGLGVGRVLALCCLLPLARPLALLSRSVFSL
jgi:hypothetical protein